MRVDERVSGFAEAAGHFVDAPFEGVPARFSSGDVELVLSRGSREFTVKRISRGVVEATDLATRSFAAVERYMVLVVGPSWRTCHGLPWLRVPPKYRAEDPGPLPAGMLAVPDDGYTVLTWHDETGPQTARLFARSDAYALAWALPAPLEALIASYQDPEGRPLFA